MKIGLVGYGSAGRIFHAPLISGVPGMVLYCVCSSKTDELCRDWPQAKRVSTAKELFSDDQIDVVVIATGNESHYRLAREALQAGKHVVVDKPCTVTLTQTQDLLELARSNQRLFTVFQNRRWDGDFLGLKTVIDSGRLGRIVYMESHFDRYRPLVPDRWREKDLPGSGLWYDLGAHLVDQATQLFGAPEALMLDKAQQRDGAVVEDYFHAQLRYGGSHPGLRVILHASTLVPRVGPRFVVHGTLGSFVKYGFDSQEDDLKSGFRPQWGQAGPAGEWGYDPRMAEVTIGGQAECVAVPPGNYLNFYVQLRDHLLGHSANPAVRAEEIELAMRLLTIGNESARKGSWIAL